MTGSKFATLHEELKKFGSYYFENRPKMAYEIRNSDKITKYVCTILSQHGIIIYITLRETTPSTFVPMLIYRINPTPVSYTHLDVYKRQTTYRITYNAVYPLFQK